MLRGHLAVDIGLGERRAADRVPRRGGLEAGIARGREVFGQAGFGWIEIGGRVVECLRAVAHRIHVGGRVAEAVELARRRGKGGAGDQALARGRLAAGGSRGVGAGAIIVDLGLGQKRRGGEVNSLIGLLTPGQETR